MKDLILETILSQEIYEYYVGNVNLYEIWGPQYNEFWDYSF
jgi:hypothetical protein